MIRAPLRRIRHLPTSTRRAAALPRRYASTAPSESASSSKGKKRSWKGSALRWGAAAAAVYWYNTSPIFADDPAPATSPAPPVLNEEELVTVDKVVAEKRKEIEARAREREAREAASKAEQQQQQQQQQQEQDQPEPTEEKQQESVPTDEAAMMSPGVLEEEADQQGAFDPETGEINWDCPCLGGMAHGPCGPEFREAFSCFVYSKEEPKGMDCIDNFQAMQDCFKLHPDVYGAELMDDDEEGAGAAPPDAETPVVGAADAETPAAAAPSEAAALASGAAKPEEKKDEKKDEKKKAPAEEKPEVTSPTDPKFVLPEATTSAVSAEVPETKGDEVKEKDEEKSEES